MFGIAGSGLRQGCRWTKTGRADSLNEKVNSQLLTTCNAAVTAVHYGTFSPVGGGGFPRTGGPLSGASSIKLIIFWDLSWSPLFLESPNFGLTWQNEP